MTKKVFLLFLLACVFVSCKKDKKNEPEPEIKPEPEEITKSYSNKIILKDAKATDDNVELSWSELDTINFLQYTIVRRDQATGNYLNIHQSRDQKTTKFTDVDLPYSPEVKYQVIGQLHTGALISSNVITYLRPDIKPLNITPFDVIFDKDEHSLYLFEKNGKISIYDLQKKEITKTINTSATIGYCDIAIYKNKKELYVPRNDGWIFIYDANTLEKISQISTGLASSCIVFNSNKLFVSTAAWTNRPIKVYDRATGQKISETGDFELTRFKKIPNSNTELLEITINIGPVDQDYYKFNTDGSISQHMQDRYHGDYPLDAGIFEIFPDGSKYITSSMGSIYTKNLTYVTSLPRGNLYFSAFALNQNNQLIYAGCQTKNIEVYSMSDYEHKKTIKTKAYPFRLFEDGNKIISVSSISAYSSPYGYSENPSNIVIESLDKN
ncbi:MAG: WD40 repeat domain-containing protein [Sphingobacteriaceae bacterium]|nr:MAG: WD40 repeat domain-containing protein [Sphingobacteriaceae bacterium]